MCGISEERCSVYKILHYSAITDVLILFSGQKIQELQALCVRL